MSREVNPKRLRNMRCNGCKRTVTLLLIYDGDGKKKYECAGSEKDKVNGCGWRVDPLVD